MERPLWQILFTLSFVGFALQRVVVGFALHEGAIHPVLFATFALQCVLAVLVAVGMWFGRKWTVGALLTLGALLVAAALQTGFWLDLHPPVASLSEAIIVALVTGALALALRYEFDHDVHERDVHET